MPQDDAGSLEGTSGLGKSTCKRLRCDGHDKRDDKESPAAGATAPRRARTCPSRVCPAAAASAATAALAGRAEPRALAASSACPSAGSSAGAACDASIRAAAAAPRAASPPRCELGLGAVARAVLQSASVICELDEVCCSPLHLQCELEADVMVLAILAVF